MPPTKFQINPTNRFGADVVSRFSRWSPWLPSWILEGNEFSNSKSPKSPQCLPTSLGSIQLTVREQTWFEDFQDGHRGSHLGYWNRMILATLNVYVAPMPSIKFQLNPNYGLGRDVFLRFSRWPTWQPFWISDWNDFSNSKPPSDPNAIQSLVSI